MIFRVIDNKLYQVKVNVKNEDEFIKKNKTLKFIKVNPQDLPTVAVDLGEVFYELDANGNIVIDLERTLANAKDKAISDLNENAKGHILSVLKSLDWGDTYEECLTEIQSSALALETRLLYTLKPKLNTFTLTDLREKLSLFLAGQYTQTDLMTELQNAGLTQQEIDTSISLFVKASEVAKLMYWIEQVWEYEEQIEIQINQSTTIDELHNIMSTVNFPVFQ